MLALNGLSNVRRRIPWALRTSTKPHLVKRHVACRPAPRDALEQHEGLGPKRFPDRGCGIDQPPRDGRPRPNAVRPSQRQMGPVRALVARPADLGQRVIEAAAAAANSFTPSATPSHNARGRATDGKAPPPAMTTSNGASRRAV